MPVPNSCPSQSGSTISCAPKMILLFNHSLTQVQIEDARNSLGVREIVEPPDNIKAIWANIRPEIGVIDSAVSPVCGYVESTATKGDYLLVQGDFGAVFLIVTLAFKLGLRPVYSTTQRNVVESHTGENTVQMSRTFSHCRFRLYEQFGKLG